MNSADKGSGHAGQIFGEERFIEIYERKEHDRRQQKPGKRVEEKDYHNEISAPFTIKCVSSYGVLYRISFHEFE